MKTIFTILILLPFLFPANAANNSLTDEQLLQIKFDQKLDSQVSPKLAFHDSTGKQVHLGDYFGKRPIVLMLGYYKCPMLCTLTLNGVTESFRDLKWSIGKNFDVIFVSIDPAETSKLAASKKATYLRDYGRAGSANGWHFLTGSQTSIHALADEIGFHYAYDSGLKEFVHPSGFVVLTPEGKTAHYFYGVTFSAKEVDTALRDADTKKIDSPVRELILLCCEYSPLRGKYGNLVMEIVRVGGIGTVLALGIFFIRSFKPRTACAKSGNRSQTAHPSSSILLPVEGRRKKQRTPHVIRNSLKRLFGFTNPLPKVSQRTSVVPSPLNGERVRVRGETDAHNEVSKGPSQ